MLLAFRLGLIIFFSWWERRRRPSLLFHICCAPCASYTTQKILSPAYRVTWYFYNPNLSSLTEYNLRLDSVQKAAKIIGVNLLVAPYQPEPWLKMVAGRETDPEKGERCHLCYRERLVAAYTLAKQKKFSYFSTSLLVSPYKDGEEIRKISRQLALPGGPQFLEQDFQENNGYRLSLAWAKERGLYLQKYCGCSFSWRA